MNAHHRCVHAAPQSPTCWQLGMALKSLGDPRRYAHRHAMAFDRRDKILKKLKCSESKRSKHLLRSDSKFFKFARDVR